MTAGSSFETTRRIALSAAAIMTMGCGLRTASFVPPAPGEQYRIVDCTLIPRSIMVPGGGGMDLPSGLIQTSAIDCYRRGGIAYRDNTSEVAALWLRRACPSGSGERPADCKGPTDAKLRLGELYEYGIDGTIDMARAAAWYLAAAEDGNRAAAAKIARFYEHGIGVPRDEVAAERWYRRAAGAPANDAMRDGPDGATVPRDMSSAQRWYRRTPKSPLVDLPGVADVADVSFHTIRHDEHSVASSSDGSQGGSDAPGLERNYALFIVNGDYPDSWGSLSAVQADVAPLRNLLTTKYGFATMILFKGEKEISNLTTQAKEKSQFLQPLDAFRETFFSEARDGGPRVNLLLFYLGHGRKDRSLASEAYWIPTQAPKLESGYSSEWLANSEVTKQFKEMGRAVSRILVIADSCFARVMQRNVIAERFERDPTRGPSRKILLAGPCDPRAMGQAFVRKLHAILDGTRSDITGTKLFEDLQRQLSRESADQAKDLDYGEIDDAGHESGDFLFHPMAQPVGSVRHR